MINYDKITRRALWNNRGYTFINIFGLSLGLSLSIILLLIVKEELSYDKFHTNSEYIHRVLIGHDDKQIYQEYIHGALAGHLESDFPEIVNSARYAPLWPINKNALSNGDESYMLSGCAVDPSFFNIFTFQFLEGSAGSALTEINSVILTKKTSLLLFDDEDVIGKSIRFEMYNTWIDVTISAVVKDIPYNSHIQSDFFISTALLERARKSFSSWEDISTLAYIQVHKNTNINNLDEKVNGLIKKYIPDSKYTVHLQPLHNIHLHQYGGGGSITYIYLNIVIGLVILIIGIINYINLSTALASTRVKEVCIRKIMGSNRKQIVFQFLIESLVISGLSMLLALTIIQLIIPFINQTFEKHLILELSLGSVSFIILLTLLIGLISGLSPSILLSRLQPLEGENIKLQTGSSQLPFRNIMVLVQFSISIILIISAFVINYQLNYIVKKDLGYNDDYILDIEMKGNFHQKYKSIKQELLINHEILYVTAANTSFTNGEKSSTVNWKGEEEGEQIFFEIHPVDFDYLNTFEMEIVMGRFFSKEMPTDITESIVINESAVIAMGMDSPINEWVVCDFGEEQRNSKIIGVVKDFHFQSIHKKIKPLIFVIIPWWYNELYIKIDPVSSNISNTIDLIEQTIKSIVPDYPFEYSFLNEDVEELYKSELQAGVLLKTGAGIATLIALMGLLSLAAYDSERRTKEIGIRKVLGASFSKAFIFLIRQSLKWVIIANFIAWPIVSVLMNKWLQNFSYRIGLSFWIFILSGILTIGLALIAISSQTLKIIRSKVIDSLRNE